MMKKFYGIFVLMLIVPFTFAQKISDPQLVNPTDGMENVMPDATLDWNPVSGIGEITYHLQLATDAAFTNLIVDENGIGISAYYNENLIFGQEYFWRVKATDDDGTSNWSSSFSFTVFSTVELKKPKNGDGHPLRPTFKIDSEVDGTVISGVNHFKIEIDTSADFNSPALISEVIPAVLDGEYIYISDYLLFGGAYFWRAKPYSETSEGEFDEVFEFETIVTPELEEPGDEDDEVELDILFEWEDLVENKDEPNIDIFTYELQISTDEAFTSPVSYVLDSNSIHSSVLKFATEYFWRVRASHINDQSIWSEVSSFTTVEVVELESPEDGAYLLDPRPVLEWEALTGVDGYQIAFGKSEDLSDAEFFLVESAEVNTYPLTEQTPGFFYYWSVRAINGTDTTDWANPYNFRLSAEGINDLALINNMSLYPSPATDIVTVEFNVKQSTQITWIITDVLGQSVMEETLQVSTGLFTKSINIADLKNGIYFLEISQGKESSAMKFMVE